MPCTILPLLLSSLFPKPGDEQESNRVGRPGRVMAGFRQDGTELTAAQVVRYSAVVRVFYNFITHSGRTNADSRPSSISTLTALRRT